MIRFHNKPKDTDAVLAVIREIIGEPHAHDGQTFLFNVPLPHRFKRLPNGKTMVEVYRAGGYPVDLEYVHEEGKEVRLSDGSVHHHSGGKWHVGL